VNGNDAVIVDGLRSPRGRGKSTGGLAHLHPQTLLAGVLNALADRVGLDPAAVEDVIIGNASGSDDHGSCIGRLAVLDAGWPYTVPGTVSRLATGAAGLHAGNEHLFEVYPLVPQGISADLLATLHSFDRTRLDALALRSQQRAAVAIEDGRFAHSVVAVHNPDGSVALDADELPRPTTTADTLAALAPSFAKLGAMVLPEFGSKTFDELALSAYPELDHVEHVHHPGNSSGVADGASAILLASRTRANELGLRPRARIVQTAVAGSEPVVMLSGPPEAARICLAKAGMSVSDIDVWEVNEAFAAVLAHTIAALDLDESRVNVNGGALALGHPIGATGPMLIQTALDELERSDRSAALVTMCTGGGMATATIIERA
jgi:acetyl-CoA C-acetyltransferase